MKQLFFVVLLGWLSLATLDAQQREFDASEGLPVEVVDSEFNPVPGVVVHLLAVADPEERRCEKARQIAIAITGDDGKATLSLKTAGHYCLLADLDGFAPVWIGPFEIEPLEAPRINMIVPVKILLPATIQSCRRGVPKRGASAGSVGLLGDEGRLHFWQPS